LNDCLAGAMLQNCQIEILAAPGTDATLNGRSALSRLASGGSMHRQVRPEDDSELLEFLRIRGAKHKIVPLGRAVSSLNALSQGRNRETCPPRRSRPQKNSMGKRANTKGGSALAVHDEIPVGRIIPGRGQRAGFGVFLATSSIRSKPAETGEPRPTESSSCECAAGDRSPAAGRFPIPLQMGGSRRQGRHAISGIGRRQTIFSRISRGGTACEGCWRVWRWWW